MCGHLMVPMVCGSAIIFCESAMTVIVCTEIAVSVHGQAQWVAAELLRVFRGQIAVVSAHRKAVAVRLYQ